MTIDGLYNFRDTGGTPLTTGGTTRSGVLFRSDALSGLTQTGLDELAATEIGVIVDFRSADERNAAADRIPTSRPFEVAELALLEGAMADMARGFDPAGAPPSIPALGELYVGMVQHGAAQFAEVARLIAASTDDSPTAVLVHCTAGKDRTGVATALMLDAVGAERTAVVADYAVSQDNLAGPWADGMLHMIGSLGLPLTPELRTLVTGTPPDAIEHALAWVDSEHGGAAEYLGSGGLTPDELTGLRTRLIG
jgi:protein-tyrosine phosphatase